VGVLSWVLKTPNFEDKISIRRRECNTPIKITFLIEEILSTRTFNKSL
jgi:hypothetical protein